MNSNNTKKLLFIVNVDWFFLSHRLPVALAAIQNGYDVHILTRITDKHEILCSHGLTVHTLQINRSKVNFFHEINAFISMVRVIKKIKPDIIHLVTIKPVIYGGIAARVSGVKNVVAAIAGLGFIFSESGWKARIRRSLVSFAYRSALNQKNLKVIFQNPTDRSTLSKITSLNENQKIMIPGSGVDLSIYSNSPLPTSEPPIILLAARLLHDKGVGEFVQASRVLKEKGVSARFCLVGTPDPANPNSVSDDELSQWVDEGVVESWGHCTDMPAVLSKSYLVVLPSYYGEGLPKVLIEAAACGRAVITTDMPGCRDAIIPDETGFLIPARNADMLADFIQRLIADTQLCRDVGQAGRLLAVNKFSIESVIDTHLKIYNDFVSTS